MIQLDNIDLSLLSYLRDNAKASLKDLAAELKVHPNTIFQRLKKLEEAGVVTGYVAEMDFARAGYDLHSMIMLKLKRANKVDMEQIKQLLKISELEAIYAVSGVWDVIALCRVKNRRHLLEVIQKINDHPIIVKSSSSLILFEYKTPAQFNPFPNSKSGL